MKMDVVLVFLDVPRMTKVRQEVVFTRTAQLCQPQVCQEFSQEPVLRCQNAGWTGTMATMATIREVFFRLTGSARRKGAYDGLEVLPRAEALCCFLGDWSSASPLRVFFSSNSKTSQEDKGAGEGVGLLRFQWHTSFSLTMFEKRSDTW